MQVDVLLLLYTQQSSESFCSCPLYAEQDLPGTLEVRMKDLLRRCRERQVAGLAFLPSLLDEALQTESCSF